MTDQRFPLSVMIFLVAILGYLAFLIMKPFLIPISWAIVFSILFFPINAYIARRVRVRAIGATVTLLLIVIVILGPFTSIVLIMNTEVKTLVAGITASDYQQISDILDNHNVTRVTDFLRSYIGEGNLPSSEAVAGYIKNVSAVLVQHLSAKLSDLISTVVDFLMMLFTTFFLLKDGPVFFEKLKGYLPFRPIYNERLAAQVKDMVVSTVYGGVTVAIAQGVLGGLIFWILGIESPILWGFVMSIMSFVPLIGTFAVWGPAAAFLVFKAEYLKAFILILFGIFVISMVDNILKPLIIGTRTKMHTIVIFFSVLGGLKLFGIIGLILGPLITALFLSMLEIFRHPDSEILIEKMPPSS